LAAGVRWMYMILSGIVVPPVPLGSDGQLPIDGRRLALPRRVAGQEARSGGIER
jgi:hypothetical protein